MEENLQKAREQFGQILTNPEARELWNAAASCLRGGIAS